MVSVPFLAAVGLLVGAYLCGSIPFGVLVTRWKKGVDVRAQGSGNIGATNVARVAGKKLGVLVLVLDALKGLVPVLIAKALFPSATWLHAAVGSAAFFGHVFPVWLRFHGGKGVATALGVLFALVPWAALAGAVVYAIVFGLFRVSSIGSLCGALVALAVALWLGPGPYVVLTALLFGLILFTHRGNIRRILQRSERRI